MDTSLRCKLVGCGGLLASNMVRLLTVLLLKNLLEDIWIYLVGEACTSTLSR